tara:strand:- start:759 stop:1013 length:255 start_codon:yes stop_codon:yes gene_type:complete
MTTKTYKIELTYDAIDSILVQTLQTQFEELTVELENRMGEGMGYGIFHTDKKKDIVAIKAQLEATEVVLRYNMTEKECDQWKSA